MSAPFSTPPTDWGALSVGPSLVVLSLSSFSSFRSPLVDRRARSPSGPRLFYSMRVPVSSFHGQPRFIWFRSPGRSVVRVGLSRGFVFCSMTERRFFREEEHASGFLLIPCADPFEVMARGRPHPFSLRACALAMFRFKFESPFLSLPLAERFEASIRSFFAPFFRSTQPYGLAYAVSLPFF